MKRNKIKKYIFTLKNIDTEKIDRKFKISIVSNVGTIPDNQPKNTTKISDLTADKNAYRTISFLDEVKNTHKCKISVVRFQGGDKKIFDTNQYDCFWCRHLIPKNTYPLSCPIKYVPNQAVKTYCSEISKDFYIIKENIIGKEQNTDNRIEISKRNYYISDGLFCSFNCVMAYIDDKKANSMYNMSEMLLLKIYNDTFPRQQITSIMVAPHWRKLRKYTGDLTIEEFRNGFNKIEYQNHGFIVYNLPKFTLMGTLFEEHLKF